MLLLVLLKICTFVYGNYGKVGHCNYDHDFTPSKIGFFSIEKIYNVACGNYNSVAVNGKELLGVKNSH